MSDIREVVREKYAFAITNRTNCCGNGGGCCSGDPLNDSQDIITGQLYDPQHLEGISSDLILNSFGCGNPTALAELHPGEVVLDLGSGAGLDVLLSARRVGPNGKAYGVDMTDEMLQAARENQKKAGIENAEFLKGHIEDIPLPDDSVDIIISNCVINLSVDKDKVIQEAYRVLKPGGRFAVSDIVLMKPLPDKVRSDLLAWAGCIAGAMLKEEYENCLKANGFSDLELITTRTYDLMDAQLDGLLSNLSETERSEFNGSIVSAFIRAKKV